MATNGNEHSGGNGNGYRRYSQDVEGSAPGRRRRGRASGKSRFLRWLVILLIIAFILLVAVVGGVAGTVLALSKDLPNIADLKPRMVVETSFVYDKDGRLIGELHGAENRVIVTSAKIPQVMKDATVAIEDERFYQHHGIDMEGLARAVWTNIKAGATVQGASTITAQFVRNAYVEITQEKTFTRKIKEAVISWQLEDKWSKDQILTGYLNTIYYGRGSYGVEAIARTLFHKSVANLTVAEAALLAGIANAPSYFDPVTNPEAAKDRRDTVLRTMQQQGYITQSELDEALATPLKVFKKAVQRNVGPQQYFLDYVTRQLVAELGQNIVFGGGLRIYTSLNTKWQEEGLDIVKGILYAPEDPAAALVAIDPKNGYIRAMVGGMNFKKQKYNLAWQAQRQLGSAAKPFTLARLIEAGANPSSTYYTAQNVTIDLPGHAPYPVAAHGAGSMNLISATAASENSIFVQMAADLMTKFGDDAVIDMMHRMGFQSDLAPIISAVLGTNLVNPLETASAYATLASGGVYHKPQGVKLIKNSSGKVIYKAKVKGKRVISDGVAYYTTQCLEAVISSGTGASNGYIGRPAAGKTGTTDSNADAWFCGYTPQLATAVWMGYPDARIAMNNVHGQQVWGGDYPTIIWSTFMRMALANAPVLDFAYPNNLPLWSKWDGKYAGMSPSPSPSPSPSKTKKPKPKPTTAAPTVTPTLTPSPSPVPTPTPTLTPTPIPTTPPPDPVPTTPPPDPVPTTPPPSPVVRGPLAALFAAAVPKLG